MSITTIQTVLVVGFILVSAGALNNGLAENPPLLVSMGCLVNQNSLRTQIDAMNDLGFAKKGYQYIVIEDCWQGIRDSTTGRISQDKSRFPSGLQKIVEYAHWKKLMIGLGTDIGRQTSQKRNGSMGYEKQDAKVYAEWGIDWILLGNSQNLTDYRQRFVIMSAFLQQIQPPILIALDNGPTQINGPWPSSIANLWKSTPLSMTNWQSLRQILLDQLGTEIYAGSGAWNYAGSLNTSLPDADFLAHLVSQIVLKSPIQISAPLNQLSNNQISYLLNDQLLAIRKDLLKKQGKVVQMDDYQQGWQAVLGGPLSQNRYVLVFLNGGSSSSSMSVSLSRIGVEFDSYWVRDPLSGKELGVSSRDEVRVEKVSGFGTQMRILHF